MTTMDKGVSRIHVAQASLTMPTDERHWRWLLARRPIGRPQPDDFLFVEDMLPLPPPGKFLARVIYLSIDPKQRLLMNATPRFVELTPLYGTLFGMAVGEVILSNHPDFRAGDIVTDLFGWQSHAVADGKGHYSSNPHGTRKIDPAQGPISTALGVLGSGGLTAYFSVMRELKPRRGETMVVSSAAGNVGLVAGQIGKILGCRVIGLTSTDEKCATLVRDFGYDEAINYRRAADLAAAIRGAAPKGVDLYYDNVGGPIAAAVATTLNPGARVTLVGIIDNYNSIDEGGRPWHWPFSQTMKYFIIHDYHREYGEGLRYLSTWINEGRLRYREDIWEGLEKAPEALLDLFDGGNIGKRLIRVAPNPPGIA
ncbi:MAG: NADP-dependent oxidoreductase [Alphaproteobacteria bacterium]|nr:NADP-dependent oxidoreductase [Alphaproteobacteria bacterium]